MVLPAALPAVAANVPADTTTLLKVSGDVIVETLMDELPTALIATAEVNVLPTFPSVTEPLEDVNDTLDATTVLIAVIVPPAACCTLPPVLTTVREPGNAPVPTETMLRFAVPPSV